MSHQMCVSRQPDNLVDDVLAGRVSLQEQQIISSTCTRKEPHVAGQWHWLQKRSSRYWPAPLSFRFSPLGSGGLPQKQPPQCFSFSSSTSLKPCSVFRGALRDVATSCAAIADIASSLHCSRYTTTTLARTSTLSAAPPNTHWLRPQKSLIEAATPNQQCLSSRMSSNRKMLPDQDRKQTPAANLLHHAHDGRIHGPAKMWPQKRSKSSYMSARKR
jgi:hypothetical protein